MSNAVSTVVLIAICWALNSHRLSGQVTFEDLRSGYLENRRGFDSGSYRMKWTNRVQVLDQWLQATKDHNAAIQKRIMELRADDPLRQSWQIAAGPFSANQERLESLYGKKIGLFEYFCCPGGKRLKAGWGEIAEWQNPDSEEIVFRDTVFDLHVYTLPRSAEFFSVGASRAKLSTNFSVYPVSQTKDLAFKNLTAPIPFAFLDGQENFVSPLELLFSDNPSDSRLGATYDVQLEGDIAVVTIEESPKNIVASDGSFKTGHRIYAEIEMDKGCLPRLIKIGRIGDLNGKKLTAAADSYSHQIVRLENSELKGVGFYPARITDQYTMLVSLAEDMVKLIDDKGLLGQFIYAVSVAADSKNVAVPSTEILTEVRLCEPWEPEDEESFFSLEPPQGADRIDDRKQGTFSIARGIEHSLAIDLNRVPMEADADENRRSSSRLIRWAFWLFMSIVCLLYLYRTTQQPASKRQNDP